MRARQPVEGHLARPMRADPMLDRIAQRGREHEARFLGERTAEGVTVVEIAADEVGSRSERIARGRDATLEAMRTGADVIYQAVLFDGRRLGYADFLRRVEWPATSVRGAMRSGTCSFIPA